MIGGLLLSGAGKRQESPVAIAGAILTEKDAYVALPPEVVSPSGTERVISSPDGKYILIQRTMLAPTKSPFPDDIPPKRAELSLLLWNTSTRQTSVLWRRTLNEADIAQPSGVEMIDEIQWLPKSSQAFVQFVTKIEDDSQRSNRRLAVVDASRGSLRNAFSLGEKDELIIATDRPLAVLRRFDKSAMQVLSANGVPGSASILSDNAIIIGGWMPNGKTLWGVRVFSSDALEAEKKKRWVIVDIQSGAVSSVEKRPEIARMENPPAPPFVLKTGQETLKKENISAEIAPIWLEGKTKETIGKIFVTSDGEQPELLPGAVLYRKHGALFALPLIRMDRETYTRLETERQRRVTLANAKQIGLAMMMYCQDYDENFPPSGEGKMIAEVVNPYLKNDSVFKDVSTGKFGFTPAYNMTALSSYNTPATTPLGYLTGPGGRVIIYVDGHVTWE